MAVRLSHNAGREDRLLKAGFSGDGPLKIETRADEIADPRRYNRTPEGFGIPRNLERTSGRGFPAGRPTSRLGVSIARRTTMAVYYGDCSDRPTKPPYRPGRAPWKRPARPVSE